VATEEAVFLET